MAAPRSDALRNRRALLAATRRLVDRSGAGTLRVAEVAHEAGVGPGTLYRAFGSKGALLHALLDEEERDLQDAVLRGRPPLGPGARATERLIAFVDALHALILRNREVLLVADGSSPLARQHTGAHDAWRTHLASLLDELRPGADAAIEAELLLAALAPGVATHLIDELHHDPRTLRTELLALTRSLMTGPGGPC